MITAWQRRGIALFISLFMSAFLMTWTPHLLAAARDAIPDIEVQDQTGRTLHFNSDLLKGHIVAINFIFTGCTTVCPLLGASSIALSREMAKHNDPRYRVISVSIDPQNDTPERLQEWRSHFAHFGDSPSWTLVTGKPRDMERLLRALQVYSADKDAHSGNYLLGNPATNTWKLAAGSTAPAQLASTLKELGAGSGPIAVSVTPAATPAAGAAHYLPDTLLIDQNGKSHRFYSDLVKGRIVVINTFFSDCSAVCPITLGRLANVQTQLGERVGRDVFLLSITVDPVNDTPQKLGEYARRFGDKPGWQFLTGKKSDVDLVLKKIGQYVNSRDAHSNLMIIGNEPTGLWKKANGLASNEELTRIISSVINDGH